jgi:hypothetical protein
MDSTSLNLTPQIRLEFSFSVNDETLNNILAGLAARGVSLTGYMITKMDSINFARIVVGPPQSNSPRDNYVVREVLRSAGVRFQEKKVIQLLGLEAGTPGVLSRIFQALFHQVRVNAIYAGELNAIFLNVSNINLALRLLKQNHII